MNEEKLRRLLGRNAGLTARARRQEGVIREKAGDALEAVQNRLAGASPADAILDEGKGVEYRRAVAERARLSLLLGSPTSS